MVFRYGDAMRCPLLVAFTVALTSAPLASPAVADMSVSSTDAAFIEGLFDFCLRSLETGARNGRSGWRTVPGAQPTWLHPSGVRIDFGIGTRCTVFGPVGQGADVAGELEMRLSQEGWRRARSQDFSGVTSSEYRRRTSDGRIWLAAIIRSGPTESRRLMITVVAAP